MMWSVRLAHPKREWMVQSRSANEASEGIKNALVIGGSEPSSVKIISNALIVERMVTMIHSSAPRGHLMSFQ